jgi:hypothetical protein
MTRSRELFNDEEDLFKNLLAYANAFIAGKTNLESFRKFLKGIKDKNYADSDGYHVFGEKNYTQKLCEEILEKTNGDEINSYNFGKFIELAMVLDDDLLVKILEKKPELIEKIEDHGKILNIAIELKSTETFKILINNNFDPQKKDKNTLSIFALAAQNQGADYLEKYAATLPEETVKNLILEQDKDGKDALSHAIEGRSYAKTIEFLLKNNANIEHRFEENLKTAIIKKHNQTLEILLKKTPKGFAPDYILLLSNFAKVNKNHLAHFFLQDLVEDNSEAQKSIKQNIAEIPAYQTTDIHEICREGNLKNFEDFARRIFLKQTGFFKLINTVDQKGKTPLFYALDGNCYSELVEKLVDFRADPNFLRNNCEPDEANDALTLCAQKKEPRTLGVILKSQGAEITSKSLHNCAKALCDSENLNAETIRYFFKNVKREDLKKIESDEIFFEELVGNGIYFAPTETSKKIKDLDPEKINKVLYKAIQRSSSEIVKNFLQNFDIVNSNRTEDDYNERSCLIKSNNSSHKSYGSSQGKINPSKKTKDSTKPKLIFNFDSFFDVATGSLKYRLKDSESESPAESKEVLILLLKAGIQPSDKNRMTRNLEELGIKKEDYESSKSCYAVFCSAISSVFLSNNGRTN